VLVGLVLAAVSRALDLYADPQWAPQGWSELSELCRTQAQAAAPGSPLQLTWVRAYATAARTPAEVRLLADWYVGADLPPGLVLDDDLRWQLLQSLVRAGGAGEAEIQAESERDRSVAGDRHAMVARAMTPDPAGRAAAWTMIIEDSGAPMENRLHAAYWYASPSLAAVTPTHVADYLSTVDRLWSEQGREIGRNFARMAFPRGHVDPATLAAIDAWRASEEHPATLVRAVTEGRDQLVRALSARDRDRG
jgi:aminopeptidase N